MTLARDEKLGLAIAGLVGAAALATYAYRASKAAAPEAPEAEVEAAPPAVVADDASRAELARALEAAFVADGSPARVAALGTTLQIRWEMCSKQMLRRLLHDDENFQVKNVRAATGLSVATLRQRGFKAIVCDDGRKGLAPVTQRL